MQIPILSGIYTDEAAQLRTSYPRNLIPVIKKTGLSEGYLRHSDGIIKDFDTDGIDRGAINWNEKLYRVIGTNLCYVPENGSVTKIGEIAGNTQCTLGYSFDYLGIVGGNNFYLYSGSILKQVTTPILGKVIDFIWIDGYFILTDGAYIFNTDLNNPFSVNPVSYGSSEASPDNIVSLKKVRNELTAINRYTIEFFQNIGGLYFPFQRIEGALINKGSIGTYTNVVCSDLIYFMGSGFNEAISLYMGINGQITKIATPEIEQILKYYTETELSVAIMEQKIYNGHIHIMTHLKDKTLVYDIAMSQMAGEPIWFILDSGDINYFRYQAFNHVWAYNRWNVGDPTSTRLGHLTDKVSTHYGDLIKWEFSTQIVYNATAGAIFHSLELIAITGRVALNKIPQICTSYSFDGVIWSQRKYIKSGKIGELTKRLIWFMQGSMRKIRVQKFEGDSDSMLSIAALEANIEPCYV